MVGFLPIFLEKLKLLLCHENGCSPVGSEVSVEYFQSRVLDCIFKKKKKKPR